MVFRAEALLEELRLKGYLAANSESRSMLCSRASGVDLANPQWRCLRPRRPAEVPAHKERYAVQAFRECHRRASTRRRAFGLRGAAGEGCISVNDRFRAVHLEFRNGSAQQPSTLTRRRPALGRRRVLLLPIALLKTCLAVAWTAGGDRNGRPVANESRTRPRRRR